MAAQFIDETIFITKNNGIKQELVIFI